MLVRRIQVTTMLAALCGAGAAHGADRPTVGARAPDFSLPATNGTTVRLSGLRGREVVLAFFPKAFTPG